MDADSRHSVALIRWLIAGCLCVFGGSAWARADIVFLMPQAGHGEAAFFSNAAVYYRQQRSDVVIVDSARSLLQVREFLARSPLRGKEPWGQIVLVAHGTRWTGLAIPIFDDEGVAAPGRWREVRERGEFVPLDRAVADRETRLRVESCGLGSRPDLLQALGDLLGGATPIASVAAIGLVEFRISRRSPVRAIRIEREYGSRVRARPSQRAGVWIDASGRRHLPVQFQQSLKGVGDCRGLDPARLITRRSAMGQMLLDHALAPRDLRWDLVPTQPGCQLRGRAELIVDSDASDWPLAPIQAIESTLNDR